MERLEDRRQAVQYNLRFAGCDLRNAMAGYTAEMAARGSVEVDGRQMRKFEDQTLSGDECPFRLGPRERENSLRYTQNVYFEDLEFVNCRFFGAGLSAYNAPIHRSSASRIKIIDCVVNSFFGTGALFDEIVVSGLRTTRMPAILNACAFRHVELSGKCGRFLFNKNVCHNNDERNAKFIEANEAFYSKVDWALDISKLKASAFELRGTIPTHLIRRNPEQHFIMTRAVALSGDWKNYDPFGAVYIAISMFLDSNADDELFVACPESKKFKEQIEFFARLRSAGLVT